MSSPRPRKHLLPGDLTVIVDSREQKPFDLTPLKCEFAKMVTADYTVKGLESFIAYERKSLSDLIGCVGVNRYRFEKVVNRMLSYECRGIVVEATWGDLETGDWRSQVTPAAALGSVLSWGSRGIPIYMAGDAKRAGQMLARLLFLSARRRWSELGAFYSALKIHDPGSKETQ
jgi:DNA excision repair protein ERCC-4